MTVGPQTPGMGWSGPHDPWPPWPHSSPADVWEGKHMSLCPRRPQHTPSKPRGGHPCYEAVLCDGLGQAGGVLGAPTSPSRQLPLRGGRQRVNLFTTSAPGGGDELRLAHCPPRAGPGLSHGGQMTVEAKWRPSCSPREPLPSRSSRALPGHGGPLPWPEDNRADAHPALSAQPDPLT